MDSIKELIFTIKKRPAMYIGRNSISCLKAFIDGWYFRNSNGVSDMHIMNDFQDWVEKKYNVSTNHSWCDILLFYSQDESAALSKFFDEFEVWSNDSLLLS